MNNKNKEYNTMTKFDMNKFLNTMNKVDSQLYEIAKTLKSYHTSLNIEDLMTFLYDSVQDNVYKQMTDSKFNESQKIKDDTQVQ